MMIEKSPGVVEPVPAMIEAKLYKGPSKQRSREVLGFDLTENDYKFGLFIS